MENFVKYFWLSWKTWTLTCYLHITLQSEVIERVFMASICTKLVYSREYFWHDSFSWRASCIENWTKIGFHLFFFCQISKHLSFVLILFFATVYIIQWCAKYFELKFFHLFSHQRFNQLGNKRRQILKRFHFNVELKGPIKKFNYFVRLVKMNIGNSFLVRNNENFLTFPSLF